MNKLKVFTTMQPVSFQSINNVDYIKQASGRSIVIDRNNRKTIVLTKTRVSSTMVTIDALKRDNALKMLHGIENMVDNMVEHLVVKPIEREIPSDITAVKLVEGVPVYSSQRMLHSPICARKFTLEQGKGCYGRYENEQLTVFSTQL